MFTISTGVSVTTMKLARPVGVFVVVVELKMVVMGWADVRMQLPMKGWDGIMKGGKSFKRKLYFSQLIKWEKKMKKKNIYIYYIAEIKTMDLLQSFQGV